MYNEVPDSVMDEIVAGAGGVTESKAETAINFLNDWAGYITQFIEIVKNFFEKISGIFNSAE